MTDAPSKAYIVSHTHWDREWYRPFHQFRIDLGRTIKSVLHALESDSDFRHFLLDGQAIVLEDYLDIFPEDEGRIAELVRANALSVGPWYILPDEFLVSAEATVRNLLIGHRASRRLGGVQKAGYMPDSFGHIAQMPQILRLAGIDSFVYSRGNGDEIEQTGYEFFWRAPDGSEVLAVNQCQGYDNAAGLGLESYWEAHTQREIELSLALDRIRALFAEMRRLSQGDIYLLNNGGDHIGPQREFGEILKALRSEFSETEFLHSSMQEYVEAVKAAGFVKNRFSGEMVSGKFHFILSGVWSARMYLKQLNDLAQSTLSACTEPLAAYGRFCLGLPYPYGPLEDAWKLLLQNHPHDSICGCSTDAVHREMVPRFEGVIQACEQILRHQMVRIAPALPRDRDDDEQMIICVANPLPIRRTEVVERMVVLPENGVQADRLVLRDERGAVVPFVVADKRLVRRFWGVDYRTELYSRNQRELLQTYLSEFGDGYLITGTEHRDQDCLLTIQFVAEEVPAVGHSVYSLREESGQDTNDENPVEPDQDVTVEVPSVTVTEDTLENDLFAVRLNPDGTLDIRHKTTDVVLSGLNRLEDTEDVGDEYDYSPCPNSETVTSRGVRGVVRALEDTGLRGCLEAEFVLTLPMSIAHDRSERSAGTVECRVRTRVTLQSRSPLVAVELLFDNQAKDHRLRAEFPVPISADTIISDGHFYLNHRPMEQPVGEGWKQQPSGTYPQQEFSLVQDGDVGFAVLNRGLPEIAVAKDRAGNSVLSLTLLRAVGWLSRDDFATRSFTNAGPTLHTPDAQCLGEHVFRYAIVPFVGNYLDADIKGISQRFRLPMVSIQGVADSSLAGGSGLFEIRSKRVSVSAVKKHESRDTLVIRLYNLSGETTEGVLDFGLDVSSAWRTDVLEERLQELPLSSSRELTIRLQPYEIVTLEVEFVS